MKIYESVTWDMNTDEIVSEKSYEYNGELALCGGGPSGEVRFPSYMETKHSDWLADMDTVLTTAITGNSPFYNQTAFDPDPYIALDNAQMNVLMSYVNSIEPTTNWEDAVDNVIAKLQSALPDDTAIATAVDKRESRLAPSHMRAIGRVAASYGDINALNSSAFFIALALTEVDFQRQLNEFQNQLELNQETIRLQMIAQGIQLIIGNIHDKVRIAHAATNEYMSMNRGHVVMGSEEKNTNIDISYKDAKWDLEAFQWAGALLGAAGGGTMVPDRPSDLQTALSIGSSVASLASGPVGAAVGAGVKGLVGLIGSIF